MLKVGSLLLALVQLVVPFVMNFFIGTGLYYDKWDAEDEYVLSDVASLEKAPGSNFVILNITDTQLTNPEAFGEGGRLLKNTVRELVKRTAPDLITITGDNGWGYYAYIQLINLLESFDIPFAPILGNHDNGDQNPDWVSYRFTKAKNCLFSFGPEGMGHGNYAVNITENGKVVHSLIFMDTHNDAQFVLEDGSTVTGSDHLWENQINWYKWAVQGVQKYAKSDTVQSTVFIHKPLHEYEDAYNAAVGDGDSGLFGERYSGISCSPVNNGFFDVMKQLGSTKDCICGHNHENNFSALYEGIRLTYATKTGLGCSWREDMSGGTVITVRDDGSTQIRHEYVEPNYGYDEREPALSAFKFSAQQLSSNP